MVRAKTLEASRPGCFGNLSDAPTEPFGRSSLIAEIVKQYLVNMGSGIVVVEESEQQEPVNKSIIYPWCGSESFVITGAYSPGARVGTFTVDQFRGLVKESTSLFDNPDTNRPDVMGLTRSSFGVDAPINPNMPSKGAFDFRRELAPEQVEVLKAFAEYPLKFASEVVDLSTPTPEERLQTTVNHANQRQIFSI